MKVAILVLLVAYVAAQAPVKPAPAAKSKWLCCDQNSMWVPTWGTKCGSGRRMQAMTEKACPKTLTAPKRRAQAIVHPVSPACTNFTVKRRLQAVVRRHTRVRICKKKLGIWCSYGWKTDRSKSYTRCCRYANRRVQAVVPKKTYKCPVNIEGLQCFLNNTNKPCA